MDTKSAITAPPRDTVVLERWRVLETVHQTRHFAGQCAQTHQTVVSNPIVSFDYRTKTGLCASGIRYVLSGEPGIDGMAELVQAYSVFDDSLIETKDISNQYLPLVRRRDRHASHHN